MQVSFRYETAPPGPRVAAVLDHHGNVALKFLHNPAGQLIEVRDVPRAGEALAARSVRYAYDSRGFLAAVTDVLGHASGFEYDRYGKLAVFTDPQARSRRFEYGPTNRLTRFTEAGRIQIERDEWDNVTRTVWPDGSITRARYSARHLGPLEQADENGSRTLTLTEYDPRGNPIRRTETLRGGTVLLPDGASVRRTERGATATWAPRLSSL